MMIRMMTTVKFGCLLRKYDKTQNSKKPGTSKKCYNPSVIGYDWDDENTCIQLEPRGERGYIELRAVKKI